MSCSFGLSIAKVFDSESLPSFPPSRTSLATVCVEYEFFSAFHIILLKRGLVEGSSRYSRSMLPTTTSGCGWFCAAGSSCPGLGGVSAGSLKYYTSYVESVVEKLRRERNYCYRTRSNKQSVLICAAAFGNAFLALS